MGVINSIHNDWMGVYLVIVQGHYTECVPLKFMGLEIYGFFFRRLNDLFGVFVGVHVLKTGHVKT